MSSRSVATTNSSIDMYNVSSNESSIYGIFVGGSVLILIQLVTFSLTIILAIAYTAVILFKPTFRKNKLNWFTVNVCLASAWLCITMIAMSVQQQQLTASSFLPCRLQGFLADMSACQLMYSHCVVAISRLLTIVYANKHFFRSNTHVWFCLLMGWLVAFFAALPYLFFDGFTCLRLARATFLPYYTLIATLVLPTTIITICNARVLVFVRNSTRRVHAAGNGGQVSHTRDVILLKIMIGTLVAFVVGWTPSFTIQLFDKIADVPAVINVCFQILPALTILHGVIVLILTNQPVRIFLKQLIARRPHIVLANMERIEHQRNVPHH